MSRPGASSALRDELLKLAQGYLDGDGAMFVIGRVARWRGVRYFTQDANQLGRIALTDTFMKTLRAIENPEGELFKVQHAVDEVRRSAIEKESNKDRLKRIYEFIARCNAAIERVQAAVYKDASTAIVARDDTVAAPDPLPIIPPLPPSAPASAASSPAVSPRGEEGSKDSPKPATRIGGAKPVVVTDEMFTTEGVAAYQAKTLYERLGVSSTATQKELRVAFIRLEKQLSAEKNPTMPKVHADALFGSLCEAYQKLKNPMSRLVYDNNLAKRVTEESYASYRPSSPAEPLDPEQFKDFGPRIKKAVAALVPETTTGRMLAGSGLFAVVAVTAAVVFGRSSGAKASFRP